MYQYRPTSQWIFERIFRISVPYNSINKIHRTA